MSYSFTGTEDNFPSLVLDNSQQGPVLVNYWSPDAGPCMRLMPVLLDQVNAAKGRFLLVHINVKEAPSFAKQHNICSIPSLVFYYQGRIVNTLHGYQSSTDLQQALDQIIDKPIHLVHRAAVQAFQAEQFEQAIGLFQQAHDESPNDIRIVVDHSKCLVKLGQLDDALILLQNLPTIHQNIPSISTLVAHIQFIINAQLSSEEVVKTELLERPDDMQYRYQYSALKVLTDDYDVAMEQLLSIINEAPGFNDDIALKGLLALFSLLGSDHELVQHYQQQLRQQWG